MNLQCHVLLALCLLCTLPGNDCGTRITSYVRILGVNTSWDISLFRGPSEDFAAFYGFILADFAYEPYPVTGTTCVGNEFLDIRTDLDTYNGTSLELTDSTVNTFAVSFAIASQKVGIPQIWMAAKAFAADFELPGSNLQTFSMWIRVQGVGLLPYPMCHDTDYLRTLWGYVGFHIISANISDIVGVSGPAIPDPALPAAPKKAGSLDVVDVHAFVQSTDPKASVAFLRSWSSLNTTKYEFMAYLARNNVTAHSVRLLNVTLTKGWVNMTVVESAAYLDDSPDAPSPAPASLPQNPSVVTPAGGGSISKTAAIAIAVSTAALFVVVVAGAIGAWVVHRRRRSRQWPIDDDFAKDDSDNSCDDNSYKIGTAPEISRDEIEICHRPDGAEWILGAGSFGRVLKGKRRGVQDVALKVLHPKLGSEAAVIVDHEVRMMGLANYDRHIVRFYGACLDEHPTLGPTLVMEYCEAGSLSDILRDDSTGEYSWYKMGRRIAMDVARGIAFLHSVKIVHRDLKPSNIFLSKAGLAKIGDVGLAKLLTSADFSSSMAPTGTFAYCAPELLLGDRYSEQIDVYSYGVLLWEMIAHERPLRGRIQPFDSVDKCPPEVDQLISDCVELEPGDRPSAAAIVERLRPLLDLPMSAALDLPKTAPLDLPMSAESGGSDSGKGSAEFFSAEESSGELLVRGGILGNIQGGFQGDIGGGIARASIPEQ